MKSFNRGVRYIAVAAALVLAVQPVVFGQIIGDTVQPLVGVDGAGNPQAGPLGNPNGAGKVLVFLSPAVNSVVLIGQGNVFNLSGAPQVYLNTGTAIQLPAPLPNAAIPSQNDSVAVTGVNGSPLGYNVTVATFIN